MREEEKEQRAACKRNAEDARRTRAKSQRTATSNAETREKKRVRSRSRPTFADPSLAGFRVVPPPNTRIVSDRESQTRDERRPLRGIQGRENGRNTTNSAARARTRDLIFRGLRDT